MVKSTFILASIAAAASVAMAQQPTGLPEGIDVPTVIPSDIIAAASSLIANPSAAQSALSLASAGVDSLPTQYQGEAKSALAEASKTLAAVQNSKSSAISSHPASFVVGALGFTAVIASLM